MRNVHAQERRGSLKSKGAKELVAQIEQKRFNKKPLISRIAVAGVTTAALILVGVMLVKEPPTVNAGGKEQPTLTRNEEIRARRLRDVRELKRILKMRKEMGLKFEINPEIKFDVWKAELKHRTVDELYELYFIEHAKAFIRLKPVWDDLGPTNISDDPKGKEAIKEIEDETKMKEKGEAIEAELAGRGEDLSEYKEEMFGDAHPSKGWREGIMELSSEELMARIKEERENFIESLERYVWLVENADGFGADWMLKEAASSINREWFLTTQHSVAKILEMEKSRG